MPPTIFILGAADPEMVAIEKILESNDQPWTVAEDSHGRRVRGDAYHACIPDTAGFDRVVRVECSWPGADTDPRVGVIDHHFPGDPGYGMPPSHSWEGSSLGQLCEMLNVAPSRWLRMIAAADHCLRAAYAGECPWVDVYELSKWRLETKAAHQNKTVMDIANDVESAMLKLAAAKRISIAGVLVAVFDDETIPELPEASARLGAPFLAQLANPAGRRKIVLQSAPPEVVQVWMATCGLKDVYGDPARGLAGGYLE